MKTREIKFRGWDAYHKEMITPYCELRDGNFWGEDTTNTGISVAHEHVMQFTGLHDKNSKDIYEGDVIHSKFSDGKDCNHVIEWKETGLVARFYESITDQGSLFTQGWITEFKKEIIGNIFEHPHLIDQSLTPKQ